MDNALWFEKYRPRSFDDYVWRDDVLKAKARQWIAEGAMPHVMFHGDPGTGKTSLAYLILTLLDIGREDILYIPCSRDSKKDDLLERIAMFTATSSFNATGIKYVILDEADSITKNAQKALRADMEVYSSTTRFIFTCNSIGDIIEPLRSRLDDYYFSSLDANEYQSRLVEVMRSEKIDVTDVENISAMLSISDLHYPDLRRSIGMLQKCCVVGPKGNRVLRFTEADIKITKPYLLKAVDYIAAGRLREARTLIVQNAPVDDYPSIYRWCYQNLHLWGPTEDQKDEALLVIRKGLVHHKDVAIPEINLSATLVELSMVAKKTM